MNQTYPNGIDPAVMDAATSGAAIGAIVVGAIIGMWLAVFMTCSMMGVFIKANKPWWAALVPIYNLIVLLEIIGKPLWWIVLLFIPLVSFVVAILLAHSLSKSFGKDAAYTVGLILFGIVFYPMLAFGSAQYQGPAG